MKVKNESEVVQSCPTLSDLMDCGPPGSSDHGIFQATVLEWGAIAFSDFITQDSEVGKIRGRRGSCKTKTELYYIATSSQQWCFRVMEKSIMSEDRKIPEE